MGDTNITPREHAQTYALTFPGAYAEHPWGQTVIKVKRKVFLFVNGAIAPEDGVSLSVKLPQSGADVLQLRVKMVDRVLHLGLDVPEDLFHACMPPTGG